jgi:hypothetical protein
MVAVLIVIIIVGFIAYLINAYAPIPPLFKNIAFFILVLFVVIYLLQAFGINTGLPAMHL